MLITDLNLRSFRKVQENQEELEHWMEHISSWPVLLLLIYWAKTKIS